MSNQAALKIETGDKRFTIDINGEIILPGKEVTIKGPDLDKASALLEQAWEILNPQQMTRCRADRHEWALRCNCCGLSADSAEKAWAVEILLKQIKKEENDERLGIVPSEHI